VYWREYTVLCDQAAVETIAAIFHQLESNGVAVEEARYMLDNPALEPWAVKDIPSDYSGREFWAVKGYFPNDMDVEPSLRKRLEEAAVDFTYPAALLVDTLADSAWQDAWRQYYHARRIGERLVIKPTWEDYPVSGDEVIVEIDPGMAFGTGLHASTRFCLQLLECRAAGRNRALDCGSGSGILAIAAAKLGVRRVLAVDLDEEAVQVSRDNAAANRLSQQITVKEANGISVLRDETFDLILANLTADILLPLISAAQGALETGGCLIGSGVLASRWETVRRSLWDHGFTIGAMLEEEEWVGFAADFFPMEE
jgi:ribosomal protein L11 methyltransferase